VKAAGGWRHTAGGWRLGGCKWWLGSDSWWLQVVVAFLDLLEGLSLIQQFTLLSKN